MDEETIAELFIKRIKAEGKITNEMVEEVIKLKDDMSFFLDGLEDVDLSKIDMSNLSQKNFERLTFYSDKTIFSQEQKEKFNIEKLIEEGKSLNGIKSFQEKNKNINGEGTSIVLIDECFDSDIEEFKEADSKDESRVIEYRVFEPDKQGAIFDREYNYKEGDVDGHHGKTTACLAAGNTCGVAPKAKMYLFGKKGKETSNKEEKEKEKMLEAMLEHIKENKIVPDIICMPDISILSDESKKILKELEGKGCILLDSKKFWKDFLLGKANEKGDIVPNDYMEEMLNMKYDEKSEMGKFIAERIAEVKENIENKVLFPADGRTTINTKREGYKYIGSFCGASFAIAQVAGLFLLARQMNKDISYDKFVQIAKETAKPNSKETAKTNLHLDVEGMLTKIKTMEKQKREEQGEEQGEQFISDESAKKLANGEDIEDVAMRKAYARDEFSALDKEQNKDKIPTISE